MKELNQLAGVPGMHPIQMLLQIISAVERLVASWASIQIRRNMLRLDMSLQIGSARKDAGIYAAFPFAFNGSSGVCYIAVEESEFMQTNEMKLGEEGSTLF
jgi:hypothetical protein